MKRVGMVIAGLALWLGVAAAPASANDYYVDGDVVVSNPACLISTPCKTIGTALGLANADDSSADTIHVGRVDGGNPYAGIVIPDTPVTLVGGDYNSTGSAIAPSTIDGDTIAGIDLLPSAFARTIRGLTIEGGDTAGAACALDSVDTGETVENNVFDEPSTVLDGHLCGEGGSATVRNNVITGSADQTFGIRMLGARSPQIVGNSISGVQRSIEIFSNGTGSLTLANNTLNVRGTSLAQSSGIYLAQANADVTGNLITMDPATTQMQTDGIYTGFTDTSRALHLSRNRIFGFTQTSSRGLELLTQDPVTIDGDVVAGNRIGIEDDGNHANLSITNSTVWASTSREINLTGPVEATVDSSIIGDTGGLATGGGGCSSTFSRGPSTPDDCGPYSTNAAPSYLSQTMDLAGFRLNPVGNAPFLDTGNPAAPAAGALDIDGQARAIDFDGDCTARRDIGADEVLAPTVFDCTPPETTLKKLKSKKKRAKRLRFELDSSEPGSIFECSIDGGPFTPCTSPFRTPKLKPGKRRHTLLVRATDARKNVDQTPAGFSFKIKKPA